MNRMLPGLVMAVVLILASVPDQQALAAQDSEHLEALFRADQDIRSPEQRKAGKAPTLQEERERRIEVLKLIAASQLQTAEDYFRAGVILHHTSSISDEYDQLHSLGIENHLLAFFLFRHAADLGHESGVTMMAAAYNYYLRACGEDSSTFGYDFVDRKPLWRPGLGAADKEKVLCGFDPRPYLQ